MTRIQITTPAPTAGGPALELEAPDLATALAVADINNIEGPAQISEDGKPVVRITRHGGAHASFWRVS